MATFNLNVWPHHTSSHLSAQSHHDLHHPNHFRHSRWLQPCLLISIFICPFLTTLATIVHASSLSDHLVSLPDISGWPRLQLQPPARITYYNQTGAVVSCAFAGSPPPVVYWTVSSIHPSYTSSVSVHTFDHVPLYSESHKSLPHSDDFHSSLTSFKDYHRHRVHVNPSSSATPSSNAFAAGWPPLGATSSLRYVRSDGSLVFAPFHPAEYDDSVHNRRYRCVGVNQHGALLSREVHVKAGK